MAAALWVTNVGGKKLCNFPTDSCTFLTEEIMGAQKFNFAPKFPQSGGFLVPNFVFLDVDFPTRRKFVDRLKFRVCSSCYDAIVIIVIIIISLNWTCTHNIQV